MKVSMVQNNIDFHCIAFFPKTFFVFKRKKKSYRAGTAWLNDDINFNFFGWTVLLNKKYDWTNTQC